MAGRGPESYQDEPAAAAADLIGRDVREAVAEVETATGAVVHAFTTGTMVQVFLLSTLAVGDAASGPSDIAFNQKE